MIMNCCYVYKFNMYSAYHYRQGHENIYEFWENTVYSHYAHLLWLQGIKFRWNCCTHHSIQIKMSQMYYVTVGAFLKFMEKVFLFSWMIHYISVMEWAFYMFGVRFKVHKIVVHAFFIATSKNCFEFSFWHLTKNKNVPELVTFLRRVYYSWHSWLEMTSVFSTRYIRLLSVLLWILWSPSL